MKPSLTLLAEPMMTSVFLNTFCNVYLLEFSLINLSSTIYKKIVEFSSYEFSVSYSYLFITEDQYI